MEVRISEIKTNNRHRKDMGDIQVLADSIATLGLLQPIGVDSENLLIFGERRMRAFQLLGRAEIPARIVDIDDILQAEHDENEIRKAFTVSERVAIGEALEAEVGNRQGANQHQSKELPQNFGEPKRGETAEVAAKAAGFGNPETYRQAKKVIDTASPETIHAMDDGRMSVSTAAQAAELTEDDQHEIANLPKAEQRQEINKRKAHVSHNSGQNEWYTPSAFIESARAVLGVINTDPASSEIANNTVQAETFFTKDDDGLEKTWSGNVWMNPPYEGKLIKQFAVKLSEEFTYGEVDNAIVLVNNATETEWFQQLAENASAICFPSRRIRFIGPEGEKGSPLQGQAIIFLGDDIEKFKQEFCNYGFIVNIAI
jgi:ParB family transcriptional regulator, chromosome partitioning protein